MQLVLDFIYKLLVLFKLDHRTWVVKVLLVSGIALLSQSIWGVFLEQYLHDNYQLSIPDMSVHGWVLILLALLLFLLNRNDLIKLDTWHTHESSQVIKLGNNRFSVTFFRPMRCTPSLRFTNIEKESLVRLKLENWNELGFTVELLSNIKVDNIEFEADAKPGPPELWYKISRLLKKPNRVAEGL